MNTKGFVEDAVSERYACLYNDMETVFYNIKQLGGYGMRIIRFREQDQPPVLAVLAENSEVFPLSVNSLMELVSLARSSDRTPTEWVQREVEKEVPSRYLEELDLLVPVEAPEVWAAGVTYERSREARNHEAATSQTDIQTFYDKVYDADRPEIFFKSTLARTIGPGDPIHLRSDSGWQVPEPELGLVLDRRGNIIGYTIGNDMSCRDIEGENPLYLPQAKIWRNSCSIGPAVLLADAVADPYDFRITCRIYRNGSEVVSGSASIGQLKRTLDELVDCLAQDNVLFDGTVLLTGTCIVPPDEFTLMEGDRIEIEIPGIGILENPVHQPIKRREASIR